jgi:hypothetical protein
MKQSKQTAAENLRTKAGELSKKLHATLKLRLAIYKKPLVSGERNMICQTL